MSKQESPGPEPATSAPEQAERLLCPVQTKNPHCSAVRLREAMLRQRTESDPNLEPQRTAHPRFSCHRSQHWAEWREKGTTSAWRVWLTTYTSSRTRASFAWDRRRWWQRSKRRDPLWEAGTWSRLQPRKGRRACWLGRITWWRINRENLGLAIGVGELVIVGTRLDLSAIATHELDLGRLVERLVLPWSGATVFKLQLSGSGRRLAGVRIRGISVVLQKSPQREREGERVYKQRERERDGGQIQMTEKESPEELENIERETRERNFWSSSSFILHLHLCCI